MDLQIIPFIIDFFPLMLHADIFLLAGEDKISWNAKHNSNYY